jgi:hypothetical protein
MKKFGEVFVWDNPGNIDFWSLDQKEAVPLWYDRVWNTYAFYVFYDEMWPPNDL